MSDLKCSHTCRAMYAQTNIGLLCCVGSGSNVVAALVISFRTLCGRSETSFYGIKYNVCCVTAVCDKWFLRKS
jgi:hypothetical protein